MNYFFILIAFSLLFSPSCKNKQSPAAQAVEQLEPIIAENQVAVKAKKAVADSLNALKLARAYEKLVEEQPKAKENGQYLYKAGQLHQFMLGDTSGAMRYYRKVLKLEIHSELGGSAMLAMAQIYQLNPANLAKAEMTYRTFIEKHPKHPQRRLAEEGILFTLNSAEELYKRLPDSVKQRIRPGS
jgi:tetratricopeptide (TPR) repeat protein